MRRSPTHEELAGHDWIPPEESIGELRPDLYAGENDGVQNPHPELTSPTAYDVKEVHDRLRDIRDDELKEIPIMPEGSRLEQGAVYLDLSRPDAGEFKATGGMEVASCHSYVPKASVPYPLWNRLIGVQNPARLDQPESRG
jgi:hypothetical protein